MSYQPVRGFFQKLTYEALIAAGVNADNIFFDNYGETEPDGSKSWALVAMSFTDTVEDVVGCEGIESLQGSLQCNIYTPKQTGSKPGEDICLEVAKAWNQLNRKAAPHAGLDQAGTRNLNGPQTLAPDQRPHHVNVISCAWRARVA